MFSICAAIYLFTNMHTYSFKNGLEVPSSAYLVGWRFWDIDPLVGLYLLIAHVGINIIGNLHPQYVSFLVANRYYAGNWPISLFLVKKTVLYKLDKLVTVSHFPHDQLAFLYPPSKLEQLEYRVLAGRCMHLTARAWLELLPRAVRLAKGIDLGYAMTDEEVGRLLDDYLILEGELVGGTVLGWSFGDGHLSGVKLLREIQMRCKFHRSELLHLSLESLPLVGNQRAQWAIRDVGLYWPSLDPVLTGEFSKEELMALTL